MNSERVLVAMDREIDDARRKLEQLTTARAQYAAAHGVTGRKAVEVQASTGEATKGSLTTALLRVMADGAFWRLDNALAALAKEGRATTKPSVAATLARGAGKGGPFERGQRGSYRVRPGVAGLWPSSQ